MSSSQPPSHIVHAFSNILAFNQVIATVYHVNNEKYVEDIYITGYDVMHII